MTRQFLTRPVLLMSLAAFVVSARAQAQPTAFFETHCYSCHNERLKKGGLDLSALPFDLAKADHFARWVKVHDRIESGEMPPKKKDRPPAAAIATTLRSLHDALVHAEQAKQAGQGRTGARRLTRVEYENTIRDLFDLPGIRLQGELPVDDSAHGFDNNSDALAISHVNLARYLETADRVLDMAIATRPRPPKVEKRRITLLDGNTEILMALLDGNAVLLKNKQPDPDLPPAGVHRHVGDWRVHTRAGSFQPSEGRSVGLFHPDNNGPPLWLSSFMAVYPGRYRIRGSLWSFQWDKGKVLPARRAEAVLLYVGRDPRGSLHTVLGYYNAPSLKEKVVECDAWLNPDDAFGFNTSTLVAGAPTNGKNRAMGFTGPGVACDYFDIEGPLYDVWPPRSHQLLFGDLPLAEFKPADHPGVRAPKHPKELSDWRHRPDPVKGIWTVHSKQPLADADRLLGQFLPRAFRRPVDAETRQQYVALAAERLKAGDCFETAMRWAYRAALCSPDFLYHVEPAGRLDDRALACRLSYVFWRSMPDERLTQLADVGKLRQADTLRAESERLLKDPKSQRFVEDFLGQWLKLRRISENTPDYRLYPEFDRYLEDSMLGETRAYFREMLDKDLDAGYLVKSDFAMLNERLAVHYGIPGVKGSHIRRVALPASCPRGPFLTQGAILKVTADGTTTSPVKRGAFVMERLLGRPPEPPPPDLPVIEPDVRGATTIREQLAKHRSQTACAACHAKFDPPGFALESFDVIGGARTRYRSIGAGDRVPRGSFDPLLRIDRYRLGRAVDPSGVLHDGRTFHDIHELQDLLAADRDQYLKNLARQLAIYGTGRDISFGDREQLAALVANTQKRDGGIRTLILELIQSRLFQTR